MLTVRLPQKLEHALEKLATETHRSKSYYVSEALLLFLDRHENELLKVASLMNKSKKALKHKD